MLRVVNGDIFREPSGILVLPVNQQGVPSYEVTKSAKSIFPDNWEEYRMSLPGNIGDVLVVDMGSTCDFPKIANMFVQENWRHPVRFEVLEKAVDVLLQKCISMQIRTVNFPSLYETVSYEVKSDWHKMVTMLDKKFTTRYFIDCRLFNMPPANSEE